MQGADSSDARAFEPWPWILVALQTTMIAISLTFFAIASTNPDPEVPRERSVSPSAHSELAGEAARPAQ